MRWIILLIFILFPMKSNASCIGSLNCDVWDADQGSCQGPGSLVCQWIPPIQQCEGSSSNGYCTTIGCAIGGAGNDCNSPNDNQNGCYIDYNDSQDDCLNANPYNPCPDSGCCTWNNDCNAQNEGTCDDIGGYCYYQNSSSSCINTGTCGDIGDATDCNNLNPAACMFQETTINAKSMTINGKSMTNN